MLAVFPPRHVQNAELVFFLLYKFTFHYSLLCSESIKLFYSLAIFFVSLSTNTRKIAFRYLHGTVHVCAFVAFTQTFVDLWTEKKWLQIRPSQRAILNLNRFFGITLRVALGASFGTAGVECWTRRSSRLVAAAIVIVKVS